MVFWVADGRSVCVAWALAIAHGSGRKLRELMRLSQEGLKAWL